MTTIRSQFINIDDLRLHCLVAGEGEPVLLLHGWPTNAQLWRHVLTTAGEHRKVIALDLPGYGLSDKPTEQRYSFGFYERVLDGVLDALGVETLGLGVHDLGGPIGLRWAVRNLDRVSSLAMLNTLVFPEMSWAVKAFVGAMHIPGLRGLMSSQWGITTAMRLGMAARGPLSPEVAKLYYGPYPDAASRKALIQSATGLSPRGFKEITAALPTMKMPVRLIYGEVDRALPDVAKTMARVHALIPHAEVTALPNVGHFLQEDAPQEVASLLSDFFAQHPTAATRNSAAHN